MSNKSLNSSQDYRGPKDLGGACMTLIFIVGVIWFFGFRSHAADISIDEIEISAVTPAAFEGLQPFVGYINEIDSYAFNYPSKWQGIENGNTIQFLLPEGAMVYVYVDTQITDVDSFKSNSEEFSVIMNQVDTEIDGLSAQCLELAESETQNKNALVCFIPKNGKGYILSLAELSDLDESDRKIVEGEFMDLLLSFRFLE